LLRPVGPALLLAGLGLWLLTEMGLLVVSAPLVLVGPVLLVVPSILLPVAECA